MKISYLFAELHDIQRLRSLGRAAEAAAAHAALPEAAAGVESESVRFSAALRGVEGRQRAAQPAVRGRDRRRSEHGGDGHAIQRERVRLRPETAGRHVEEHRRVHAPPPEHCRRCFQDRGADFVFFTSNTLVPVAVLLRFFGNYFEFCSFLTLIHLN